MGDEEYFSTVRIAVTERWHVPGAPPSDEVRELSIDASSLAQTAAAAVACLSASIGPDPICVISGRRPPEVTFATREHFIPEGLGYGWAALPVGTGTCDQVNQQFAQYETEWLRQGWMGAYRPFYVSDGKDEPPAYYAPTKKNKRAWLSRDERGELVVGVAHNVRATLPDEAPPGVVSINVARNKARPVWVSLALHKLALLSLWLCRPQLVFSPEFVPLRAFLRQPSRATYFPFFEDMVEGAWPGAHIDFRVEIEAQPSGEGGGTLLVRGVSALLRIHHMQYGLVLVGHHGTLPARLTWVQWRDPSEKELELEPIAFGFGSMKRNIPTTESIREAAYYRWLSRGGGHGRDQDDWFAAEQQMLDD